MTTLELTASPATISVTPVLCIHADLVTGIRPVNSYPRMVNLTVADEHLAALRAARAEDRIAANSRLRALIAVCLEDNALGERAVRVARGHALTIDRTAGRRWTGRITLELTDQMHAELVERFMADGVQVLGRIRAMVELWAESKRLQQRVQRAAREGVGRAS